MPVRSSLVGACRPQRLLLLALLGVAVACCCCLPLALAAWGDAPTDVYPFAPGTPASIVQPALKAGHALPLRAPGADCVAAVKRLYAEYQKDKLLTKQNKKMLGAMIVRKADGAQQLLYTVSGWAPQAQKSALEGLSGALGGNAMYVHGTDEARGKVCAWARETMGAPHFAAKPQTCLQAFEPKADWEYVWDTVSKDVLRKVAYRPDGSSGNYQWTEEMANKIGGCAGTKLVLLKPDKSKPLCLAEMYYGGVDKSGQPASVAVQSYAHSLHPPTYVDQQLVPSCSTCQGVIPALLDGRVAAFERANAHRAAELKTACDDSPQAAKAGAHPLRAKSTFPNGRCTQTQQQRVPLQMKAKGILPATTVGGRRVAIKKLKMMRVMQPMMDGN